MLPITSFGGFQGDSHPMHSQVLTYEPVQIALRQISAARVSKMYFRMPPMSPRCRKTLNSAASVTDYYGAFTFSGAIE
jgi:hypothetical protein